jgi:hypothetical protein
LRAIFSPIASPVTYDGQNLAQSPTPFYPLPRILESHGKHNYRSLRR